MRPMQQRKSPRLPGYDYSQSGAYFVTICTHLRQHTFGTIENASMSLTPLGMIAQECWNQIPRHYPIVELDGVVVMPNHMHGILVLHEQKTTIGAILGAYKAAVTRDARKKELLDESPLWQTSYHDHIIRNEVDYLRICKYIDENPQRWQEDVHFS